MGIVRGFAEIAKEKFAPKIVRKVMFKMSERIVRKNAFSAKWVERRHFSEQCSSSPPSRSPQGKFGLE